MRQEFEINMPRASYTQYSMRAPHVLQLLVWEATPLRLMIEFLFMILFYYSVMMQIDDAYRYNNTFCLALGIILASVTIYIDRGLLCRSRNSVKRCNDFALQGDIEKALQSLNEATHAAAPPPSYLYYAKAAELSIMKGDFSRVDYYLAQARKSGIQRFECGLITLRGMLYSKKYINEKVSDEHFICQPLWMIEKAMCNLFREDDYISAKQQVDAIKLLPNIVHSSSASTHDLCHLISLCMGLHTGKAVECLPQLNVLLSFIKYQILTIPEIRPCLAFAYLERAKYYSRRKKQWAQSRADIETALSLCKYPSHTHIAEILLQRMC